MILPSHTGIVEVRISPQFLPTMTARSCPHACIIHCLRSFKANRIWLGPMLHPEIETTDSPLFFESLPARSTRNPDTSDRRGRTSEQSATGRGNCRETFFLEEKPTSGLWLLLILFKFRSSRNILSPANTDSSIGLGYVQAGTR